ncbi:hypothetical protein ACS0TY_018293 [Phlomoides rotata]
MVKSAEEMHPVKAFGWAATDTSGNLSPFHFSRRHEISGVVTEVGSMVRKVKIGDKVGVGCMAGSCRSCDSCSNHLENYCSNMILTYRSTYFDGTPTYGGYSDIMVCDEHFVVRWPDDMPLDAGCPLLCAGITTYSPLKYYGLDKPGTHLGVVGLGGLGHVAVKFAKAFGAKVTVISTAPNKKDEAIKNLGVDSFLVSHDQDQMMDSIVCQTCLIVLDSRVMFASCVFYWPNVSLQAATGTMDGILDTVSAHHSIQPLLNLLKPNGKLIVLGVIPKPLEVPVFPLLSGRKTVAGSGIGGMKETQEMMDFAAKHNITADVEVIPMGYINQAMERLEKADVKYRFVIDIAATLKDESDDQ